MNLKIKACFSVFTLLWAGLGLHYCSRDNSTIMNPIVEGFYADPSIVAYGGSYYIYATIDPWGSDELAVLVSKDFRHWEQKELNWPTKEACTSPTSSSNMVWAPSVIRSSSGMFYMYVSVGSEIWVGVSDHPLGPWKNARSDNGPLVSRNSFPQVHNIDAACFEDDDGHIYLYWGSGYNWTNGHCMAGVLNRDMASFNGEIHDVTPPNYFEAPFMLKNKGKYYLMYSEGKCMDETYKVRYSIGFSPLGPWKEPENSPILHTIPDSETIGPGHHSVFISKGRHYILYHRIHSVKGDELLRELCLARLDFSANGLIKKIKPEKAVHFIN